MKKVHARRLLKLADFLDTLSEDRFDFGTWVGCGWEPGEDLVSCGTTACALGWATAIPEFQKLGLRMKRAPDGWNHPGIARHRGDADRQSERASEVVFGLSPKEHDFLFQPGFALHSTATKAQVAKHIRKFVAERCPT